MKESNIQTLIQLSVTKHTSAKMFRNNVGTGWVGRVKQTSGDGVYIENARPLYAGLCVGSGDLIGWKSVVVTPEMVGKKIAVFTSIEVKEPHRGRASREQLNWISNVCESGGIAGIATSGDEAVKLIENGIS